jgi:hypothetical protein
MAGAGLIYRFPTNVSMDVTTQEYVVQTEKLLGIQEVMPFQDLLTQTVRWDELDNDFGMTAPHKYGTDPHVDTRAGSKVRQYTAIPFKETDVIREDELLNARQFGTLGGVVDLTDVIGRVMKSRTDKTFIRCEWCVWKAAQGELEIEENGVYVHETFPVQTYDAVVDWDNRAGAFPLRDFNAVKELFVGTGASGEDATAYLNTPTLNWLLENTNQNDIAGFRSENFRNTTFSLEDLNKIQKDRKLPLLKEYNEGAYGRDKVFRKYIPDGVVIVKGKRPGTQVPGNFGMTPTFHRTKNGLPAPGFFNFLEVNGQSNRGMTEVSLSDLGAGKNPRIENTGGVYGGPFFRYPRSMVAMKVKH